MYNQYYGGTEPKKQREEPEPGEWQYDEQGRKFRIVGKNTREYAPTIDTSFGTFYMDDLPEVQRQMKAQSEQHIRAMKEAAAKEPDGICPIKAAKNAMHTKCESKCVFYEDTGCVFASVGIRPTKDTKGSPCPIARVCTDACVMYNHGCKLTCIVKGIQPGKE